MRSQKPILLVEDDRIDALTVKRALQEIKVTNELIVAPNGEEGLRILHDQDPCIILTDLNMPKMNGIEFLRIIKKDELFRRIPVIVLTTSKEERDRIESFNLSVAGYIIKPVDYLQFVEAMKTIHLYWTLSELSG